MKKLLFYIPPVPAHNNPLFYLGALKNKLLPIVHILVRLKYEVCFCIPEIIAEQNIQFPEKSKLIVVNERDFIQNTGVISDLDYEIYCQNEQSIDKVVTYYQHIFQEDNYDLIIAWENCLSHLQKVFPDTPVLNLMPGFISRLPYPDLVFFDHLGLFKESRIYQNINDELNRIELTDRNIEFISDFVVKLKDFYREQTWVQKLLENTKNYQQYSSFALLPLQYTQHYAYRVDCQSSNYDLMIQVLNSVDESTGVIVTQYCAGDTAEKVITSTNMDRLLEQYPNLIFNPQFDSIDNISQYLLPFVGKVINCSSSLALQAILFNKNVELLCDSHLSRIIELSKSSNLNRLKIIYWLLFKANVHFPLLLDDKFLDLFITSCIERKEIQMDSLVVDYNNYLLSKFRFKRAEEKLGVKKSDKNELIEKLKDRIEKVDIVSFDIFDTLIERPFAQPVDLFILVEQKMLKFANFPRFHFAKERVRAQQIANEIYKNENKVEISLDEIYRVLADNFGLSQWQADKIKQLELDTEFSLLHCRPSGKAIYDYCKKLGKKIIFISDMYLDKEFILKSLDKNGYDINNDKLYLSSEIGKKKSDSTLFKYVLEQEQIQPKQLLHIGDNNNGDFNMPKSLGINAYRLVRSVDKMYNHKLYGSHFHIRGNFNRSLGESVLIYLIARQNFDNPEMLKVPENSFAHGNAFLLGYNIFAATIIGYVMWIYQQKKINHYDALFFMARDGHILKEVYQILYPNDDTLLQYMYGSRKLMRYTAMPDIFETLTELGSLQSRVPADVLKEIWDWDTDNPVLMNKITSFAEEQTAIEEIKKEFSSFLAQSKWKNELLLKYCKRNGIISAYNPAIIEIGYRGTLQYYLQKSLAKPISGLYYCLFDGVEYYIPQHLQQRNGDCLQYLCKENYIANEIPHLIATNGFLYETIFCSDEDTIVGLREFSIFGQQKNIRAIRNRNLSDDKRKLVVRDIHRGIRQFATDFHALLGDYMADITFSPVLAENMVRYFLNKPSGRDAGIFEGVIFESNFANESFRYIVPPRDMKTKYQQGNMYTVWKQGTEVFFRRGDLFPATKKENASNDANKLPVKQTVEYASREKERPIERWLVKKLTKKDYRKFRKYEDNPDTFFADSKNVFIKWYRKIR